MKRILSAIAVSLIVSCSSSTNEQNENAIPPGEVIPADPMAEVPLDTVNPYSNAVVEIKTFKNDPSMGGYGYDISMDGKPYIHQTNVPAVPGNAGFSTEEKARRAAELMVYKIRNNILPPALNEKELDSLGVLN